VGGTRSARCKQGRIQDFNLGASIEARKAENRGGVLEEVTASPSPPARETGERYKLPQRGPGGAAAAKCFYHILSSQIVFF